MGITLDHIRGKTFHRRKGAVDNSFTYGLDYVLIDLAGPHVQTLFSRNAFNVMSVHDVDHGGTRGDGQGLPWAKQVLRDHGLDHLVDHRIMLLAQPRMLGHVFNPVCFWMVLDVNDALLAVISEVNNTFGERHSYLCHHDDLRPIGPNDRIEAQKLFHVSPFQPVIGHYSFRFHLSDTKIGVWIDLETPTGGVFATLTGDRKPVSVWTILQSVLTRPFGSLRVITLIHYQAIKLWAKGANFRSKPTPPKKEVSKCE